jgi:hypothetical protein
MTTDQPLAGIVRRRSQLAKAMQNVEVAAAAPVGKENWVGELGTSLRELATAWSDHIKEAEAPGGLHDRILDQAPRMQRTVEAIQADHRAIAEAIEAILADVRAADSDADKEALRGTAMTDLVALARHRQHGADLIYEAYSVDIGGY